MKQPKVSLQGSIVQQREMLTGFLYEPLHQLADACSRVWGDRAKMEAVLNEAFPSVPYCKFLYALDTNAVQITSNISRDGLVVEHFGRDRSDRPYMSEALLATAFHENDEQHYQQWPYIREGVPATDFLLCKAYISLRALRPSLTAIQFVRNASGVVLGFIGADFALRDLPQTQELYEEPGHWRQFTGDPSIRATVFQQTRAESQMDRDLDTVISVVEELMLDHGVFHVSLHFSSSQAFIWVMDDPYRNRLLTMDTLIDPASCMAYPKQPYPADTLVPPQQIRAVLNNLKVLRYMDETLYLRAAALNLFTGMVGLTFSCDGFHSIPYEEFLKMDTAFWVRS
jgi:hypothetical protein